MPTNMTLQGIQLALNEIAKVILALQLAISGMINPVFGGVGAIPEASYSVSTTGLQQAYNANTQIKSKYVLDGSSLTRVAKNNPKDMIRVELGDKTNTEFEPTVKISRWDEVNFKIKPTSLLQGVKSKDKVLSFEGEKVKFKTPKVDFEMYETTTTPEGGYKYIWYLNQKPATNKVEFQIEASGLDFFYQLPLNEEMASSTCTPTDCGGSHRPENVVGSYAVYHSTKGGMNDINSKDYKVGKAFHIYRPHLIDANGWEIWGNLHIENGIYSVEIPENFYNNAVYPIKSNDTFGYETVGGSYVTCSTYGPYFQKFTSGVAGTTNTISIAVFKNGTPTVKKGKGAIYNSSKEYVAESAEQNPVDYLATDLTFYTLTLSGTSIAASTGYYLAIATTATESSYSVNARYDSTTGKDTGYDTTAWASLWPATASFDGTSATRNYSIYATYTPSAATTTPASRRRIIIFE